MKIEFYYWDMQCPINNEILRLLEKYSKYFKITFHNVKDDFERGRVINIKKNLDQFNRNATVIDLSFRNATINATMLNIVAFIKYL